MVSRRLDELEAALDVKLFHRSKSGMVLTPAGEDILDQALSMQRFAESIESSVRARDRKEEGLVTLNVPDGLAAYWIAPRLPEFLDANPKIRLTLNCTPVGDAANGSDITIAATDTARVGDAINQLATLHYVFVAANSYLKQHGVPHSLASAAGEHRTLKHVAQMHQRENWDARASAMDVLANHSLVANSSAAVVAALLAGAGIATVPSFFCHLYPELTLLKPDMAVPIRIWLISHRETMSSARVQKVTAWLQSLFETKTNPWFRDEYVAPARFREELAAIEKRLAPIDEPPSRRRAND